MQAFNRFLIVLADTNNGAGDTFMKILGILIGLAFLLLGLRFIFRSRSVIQGVQKAKYHQVAPPRKQELLVARIIGVLISLIGLYFTIAAILSFFPQVTTQ